MPDTFGDIWREVRLYCPFVPIPLAQHWVRDRYRRILDKTLWGGQVSESTFLIPDSVTAGTASVTNNSVTVTLSAGVAASYVGRQFFTGGFAPYYTIDAVNVGAGTLTLDRVYGGATAAAATYTIALTYLTPPSDFMTLISVRDTANNWRLRIRVSQDQLDRWDAQRGTAGTPWVIADYRYSSTGVPRFEIWPRQLVEKGFPFLYYARKADLADTESPVLPIRGDVLKYGAIADLALWPGTPEQRNPMYSPEAHRLYEGRFLDEVNNLMRQDQEVYITDIWRMEDRWADTPEAPLDAKFIQSHDTSF